MLQYRVSSELMSKDSILQSPSTYSSDNTASSNVTDCGISMEMIGSTAAVFSWNTILHNAACKSYLYPDPEPTFMEKILIELNGDIGGVSMLVCIIILLFIIVILLFIIIILLLIIIRDKICIYMF